MSHQAAVPSWPDSKAVSPAAIPPQCTLWRGLLHRSPQKYRFGRGSTQQTARGQRIGAVRPRGHAELAGHRHTRASAPTPLGPSHTARTELSLLSFTYLHYSADRLADCAPRTNGCRKSVAMSRRSVRSGGLRAEMLNWTRSYCSDFFQFPAD